MIRIFFYVLTFLFLLTHQAYSGFHNPERKILPDKLLSQSAEDNIKQLPVIFRKNMGQWEDNILYQSVSAGANVYFMKNKISYCAMRGYEGKDQKAAENIFSERKEEQYEYLTWNLHFIGMNKNVSVKAGGETESRTNYIKGNNPAKWCANVPDYKKITYTDIYKNIDVHYYSDGTNIKHDYVLKTGASITDIQMAYEGVKALHINEQGKLEIATVWGTLIENIPSSYQFINGERKEVKVRYVLLNDSTYGFSVHGRYDKSKELVIDPVVMAWSTFVGANPPSQGYFLGGVKVDNDGNIYATGWYTDGFPTTAGVLTPSFNGGLPSPQIPSDVIVVKFKPDGTGIIWATYVGGSQNNDEGLDMDLSISGEVYVTGRTSSDDFPVTTGAFQASHKAAGLDCFVFKLNPLGSGLVYSTFLGSDGSEAAWGVAVNAAGEAFITGFVNSSGFPVTPGALQPSFGGGIKDGFVTKLNAAGTALIYSTYIGGLSYDETLDIAVNTAGEAFITGVTGSNDYPVTPGAYDVIKNSDDAFVTKINSSGTALIYSTFLGGACAADVGRVITINAADEVIVGGNTACADFPVTQGAYNTQFSVPVIGAPMAFLSKFNPAGSALIFSTFLWMGFLGAGNPGGGDIYLNDKEEIFIAGNTSSAVLPITSCAYDKSFNGGDDVFIAKLSSHADTLHYCTYIGSTYNDYRVRFALTDPCNQTVIVAPTTHGPNFPTTTGSYKPVWSEPSPANSGGHDMPVLLKLKPVITPAFTYSITGCADVTFTDNSSGNCIWQDGPWKPGTWYWNFGDGNTSTQQNPTHLYSASGTYNVKLIVSCPMDSITIPVTVSPSLVVSISGTTVICSGTTTSLTAVSAATIYQWSIGSTTPVITVSPTINTVYTLTVSNGICENKAAINVMVNTIPVASVAGIATICSGDNVVLTASGGTTYWWSNNATTSSVSLSPPATNSYSVIVSNGNCSDTSYVTITVLPTPTVSIAGINSICKNNSTTLTGSGSGTYWWSNGLITPSITVMPSTNTAYTLTVSNGNCIGTATINITVNPIPIASIGGITTICSGDVTVLSASGGITYSWSTNAANPVISLSPTTTTSYSVIVSNGSCKDTAYATITVDPKPVAIALSNVTIKKGSSTILSGSGGVNCLWFPSTGLSCTNCYTPVASPDNTTTYCLEVTNANNCKDTACVTVKVDEICGNILVPTAFSPNGDDQNELECVFGNCIKTLNFIIYDRWGEKVFTTTDVAQCWDGKYKGKALNSGIFVYYLDVTLLSGEIITKKGNISLIR